MNTVVFFYFLNISFIIPLISDGACILGIGIKKEWARARYQYSVVELSGGFQESSNSKVTLRVQSEHIMGSKQTRHTASTSMYSLTFCVRYLLPERHQWKPAVETAAEC